MAVADLGHLSLQSELNYLGLSHIVAADCILANAPLGLQTVAAINNMKWSGA